LNPKETGIRLFALGGNLVIKLEVPHMPTQNAVGMAPLMKLEVPHMPTQNAVGMAPWFGPRQWRF
jgi:hypothetical protein